MANSQRRHVLAATLDNSAATQTMTVPSFFADVSDPTVPHILLIDDDPVLIPEQVCQAFPGARYRVEVAGTGAKGLAHVRTEPPDVILLDLRLPDQSGLEVYQAIRNIDARIPVIFVTLANTADTAIQALN